MKSAIYPGSFDPVTNGHLDVLRRACRIFDRVIVAVANNMSKTATFSDEERVQLIKENTKEMDQVEVVAFDGLIVDLA